MEDSATRIVVFETCTFAVVVRGSGNGVPEMLPHPPQGPASRWLVCGPMVAKDVGCQKVVNEKWKNIKVDLVSCAVDVWC